MINLINLIAVFNALDDDGFECLSTLSEGGGDLSQQRPEVLAKVHAYLNTLAYVFDGEVNLHHIKQQAKAVAMVIDDYLTTRQLKDAL